MSGSNLQLELFQQLKSKMPGEKPMVEQLAALLNISTDSAYRRMRGEKLMSLDEVYQVCATYKISLDHLMNLQTDAFVFSGGFVQPATFDFADYLDSIARNMKAMLGFKNRKIYYICKDIPLFHHYHFREIAAFKHYFWMKAYLQNEEFARKKFSLSDYPDEVFETGRKALHYYTQLDTTEIWNIENINSTLRQIAYYHDIGLFKSEQDVFRIYEALEMLLRKLERQADEGRHFILDPTDGTETGSYQMYYNEVFLGDNSILVDLDGNKMVHLVHNLFNYMATRDVKFCEYAHDYVQNLMRKSTLISTVSEKERARFFKYLRNRITARKENLKA